MSTTSGRRSDVFGQAEQTAHEWLATVARHLSSEDLHLAFRVSRAWLHTVRDRLSVDGAAHFAAQLPVTWRGLFYDGWQPAHVPVKYDAEQFLLTVAQDSGISLPEARRAAAAVTAALVELTSPDHIRHLLLQLPEALREVLEPDGQAGVQRAEAEQVPEPERRGPSSGGAAGPPVEARIDRLERDVQVVTEALGALLGALDEPPASEPEPSRSLSGARRAHQILLSRTSTD
jgi:uncharacterized protein (DUF2267 family)